METVPTRVTDAACNAELFQRPLVGGAYIIQYDFYAHGQCTIQCLRQVPAPDGVSFTLMRCGADEPPGIVGPPPAPPATAGGEARASDPPWYERATEPSDARPWYEQAEDNTGEPRPAAPSAPSDALGGP